MTDTATLVYDARDKLGEGIFWCPVERVLYWVDVPMPAAIQRLDPSSGFYSRWTMPEMVMSLAKRRDGTLLVASHHGLNIFDPAAGTLVRMAEPEAGVPGNRSNDGTTDARGRFWYGTMANNIAADGSYFDPGINTGALWRVAPDLKCVMIEGGIGISNSTAFSPDSRIFYFADTRRGTIFEWDFDLDLGTLTNKRVFSDLAAHGDPDGSCIDAEGFLWNARWDGGCVIRFAPDGTIDRTVSVPASRPTCCAFGGTSLDTLFITTSRLHLTAAELAGQPDAGGVFAVTPGVAGLPRAFFEG